MNKAINQESRVEATDVVIAAMDAAIDKMQNLRRTLRQEPGQGIGLIGHSVMHDLGVAMGAIEFYQNDAAMCLRVYGHLIEEKEPLKLDTSGPMRVIPMTDIDDDETVSRCPACGEAIDYCQGHGDIGDPEGFAILGHHDAGDHSQCSPLSHCYEGE